uniref:EF-hand domain family member D2 n=5 Tax=Passeriformes TaxID=9126 RepID=A0A803VIV1_FICAL
MSLCHASLPLAQPTVRGQRAGVVPGNGRERWHSHRQESRRGIPDSSVGISEQSCAQSSQPSPGTWPEVGHGWHRLWAVRVGGWRCHSEEEVVPWAAVPAGLSPTACYPMLQPRGAQAPGTGSWQQAWQHPGRFSCQVPRGHRIVLPSCRYDAGKDGFIDLMELKLMMEKLGAPQTHLGLKNMIKEVDEDLDSKLSFREFLLIFRKAAAGELQEDSGLHALARLSEIDVSTEGVKGAKNFFEAKAQAINEASKFEEEIKAEQEEKKKQAEELKQRKAAFKELQSNFTQ